MPRTLAHQQNADPVYELAVRTSPPSTRKVSKSSKELAANVVFGENSSAALLFVCDLFSLFVDATARALHTNGAPEPKITKKRAACRCSALKKFPWKIRDVREEVLQAIMLEEFVRSFSQNFFIVAR